MRRFGYGLWLLRRNRTPSTAIPANAITLGGVPVTLGGAYVTLGA